MKRFIAVPLLASTFAFGFAGCAKEEKVTKETTITTPGGKTTVKQELEVEKSGKNPPAVNP